MKEINSIFVIIALLTCVYSIPLKNSISNAVETNLVSTITNTHLESRLNSLEALYNTMKQQVAQNAGYMRRMMDSTGKVNLLNYMYRDAIIYDNIFEPYNQGIISKVGNPVGWDDTSYRTNPWNGKLSIKIGGGVNADGNGLAVNVPSGYDVLWLRVHNDKWASFRVQPYVPINGDNSCRNKKLPQGSPYAVWNETYTSGYRNLLEVSPDGSAPTTWNFHQWVPIPVRIPGTYIVMSDKNGDDWISGIAFGKNLWNHARISGVGHYWSLNGDSGVVWGGEGWHSDNLAQVNANTVVTLMVPVIPNGKNKILYLVEHNNNWLGTMFRDLLVNGQRVDRFRTTFNNPFATHFNSKWYSRYMATLVPANLIGDDDKFLTVTITAATNHNIHFRESGTHDEF